MNRKTTINIKSGFTLMELAGVVAIGAIILGIAATRILDIGEDGKLRRAQANARHLQTAFESAKSDGWLKAEDAIGATTESMVGLLVNGNYVPQPKTLEKITFWGPGGQPITEQNWIDSEFTVALVLRPPGSTISPPWGYDGYFSGEGQADPDSSAALYLSPEYDDGDLDLTFSADKSGYIGPIGTTPFNAVDTSTNTITVSLGLKNNSAVYLAAPAPIRAPYDKVYITPLTRKAGTAIWMKHNTPFAALEPGESRTYSFVVPSTTGRQIDKLKFDIYTPNGTSSGGITISDVKIDIKPKETQLN